MTVDFAVRKAAALWANGVASEDPGTANHAARVVLARRICEDIAPREGALDILSNLILIVRIFGDKTEIEHEEALALVEAALAVFVAVGAFQPEVAP